jgi:hypothetical protein
MSKHALVGTVVTVGWLAPSELQEYVSRLRVAYPTVWVFGVDGDAEALHLLGSRAALEEFLADEFGLDSVSVAYHLEANRSVVAAMWDDGSRYDGRHRVAVYDPSLV